MNLLYICIELEVSIEFIKHKTEPLDEVLNHWIITRKYRFDLLSDNNITTAAYLQMFPAVDTISGYQLVC